MVEVAQGAYNNFVRKGLFEARWYPKEPATPAKVWLYLNQNPVVEFLDTAHPHFPLTGGALPLVSDIQEFGIIVRAEPWDGVSGGYYVTGYDYSTIGGVDTWHFEFPMGYVN